jgi:MFS family permease
MKGELGERLRESQTSLVEVFRNVGLRRLNLALAGSVMGDWAYSVAVAVYAFREGGATTLGLFGVARFVSMAVAAPLMSVLADRVDRLRLMVTVDVLRAILVALAAVVVLSEGPELAVYALSLSVSLLGTAFRPAQMALLPSLARRPAELTAANVTANTIEAVGSFIGPALAGAMLVVADVPLVFAFDALTFVWSGILVALVPAPVTPEAEEVEADAGPTDEAPTSRNPLAGAGAGFRAIFSSRDLTILVALYCAQTVVAGASFVFDVAIVLDLLDMQESSVGLIDAFMGIGGLIGGFVALVLATRGRLAGDFGIGVILWSAPLLLVVAWPGLPSVLLAMALLGLGNSLVDINAFTIIQRLVPDQVMGRVFGALEGALIAGMAVGSLAMPFLINTVGLRTGLFVIAVSVLALSLLAIPALRHIDTVALAPEGVDAIRSIPLFAPLPDQGVERLARAAELVEVAAGEQVFAQGDRGDLYYAIESGRARVVVDGVQVDLLGPGQGFGEIALLRDEPRRATIVAESDLVLRAVGRRVFLHVVTGHEEASAQADRLIFDMIGGSPR